MKKYIYTPVLFVIITILIWSGFISCKHKAQNISNLRTVCFQTEILPIFQSNCAISGCHNNSESNHELNLNDYNGIIKNISPGNPGKSELYNSITSKWVELMPPPPYSPLSEIQRSLIYVWILQGANNTICDSTIAK